MSEETHRMMAIGRSDGYRESAEILMKQAKIFFEVEKDEQAIVLRNISKELFKKAEEIHPPRI